MHYIFFSVGSACGRSRTSARGARLRGAAREARDCGARVRADRIRTSIYSRVVAMKYIGRAAKRGYWRIGGSYEAREPMLRALQFEGVEYNLKWRRIGSRYLML